MSMRHPSTPLARDSDIENTYWYLGNVFTFLVTGADTGGQLAVIRLETRRGAEPPPHTHSREDEAYFLLAGTVTFQVGDRALTATPGTYVHLPRGIEHAFRIESEAMEALMLLTPAGLEEYFRHPELSEPATADGTPRPPQDPHIYARSAEILPAYGVVMPLPPA